jgi:hypothetical protein
VENNVCAPELSFLVENVGKQGQLIVQEAEGVQESQKMYGKTVCSEDFFQLVYDCYQLPRYCTIQDIPIVHAVPSDRLSSSPASR